MFFLLVLCFAVLVFGLTQILAYKEKLDLLRFQDYVKKLYKRYDEIIEESYQRAKHPVQIGEKIVAFIIDGPHKGDMFQIRYNPIISVPILPIPITVWNKEMLTANIQKTEEVKYYACFYVADRQMVLYSRTGKSSDFHNKKITL